MSIELFRCAYRFNNNNSINEMSTNAKTDEEVQRHFSIIFFVKEKDENGEEDLVMSHIINDDNGLVGLPDAIRRYKATGEFFTMRLKSLWGPTHKVGEIRMSGITFDVREHD